MITKEKARELVVEVCGRPDWLPPEDELIIVDEATIEHPTTAATEYALQLIGLLDQMRDFAPIEYLP